MSTGVSPTPTAPAVEQNAIAGASIHARKSYRRKYRKIMVKFEERMRENTGLFRDEQRIFDVSQRLAEQTDQLLQILLEFNNRPQVPSRLRFDLRPSSTSGAGAGRRTKAQPHSTEHPDEQTVHEQLRLYRNRIQRGEGTVSEYEDVQAALLDSAEFAPSRSYATLVRSHKLAALNPTTWDPDSPPPAGTLTIKEEERYLQSLDEFLDGKSTVVRSHAAKSLGSRTAEKTADREREMQLKNPVSVYNWLRKHQPQVFLQDHEPSTGDKAGKSSGPRSSKRTAGRELKQEQDYYDEDGFAVDQTSSTKGKRKRDEDTAFRPKGGRSGHPAKRRREDGGSGKKTKRSSLDTRGL